MNRRSPIRTYLPWLLACAALATTIAFAPDPKIEPQADFLDGSGLSFDLEKIATSARSFAALLSKQDDTALNEDEEYVALGGQSYPIHLQIDPAIWRSILNVGNRRYYKRKPIDIVVQFRSRSRQPAILTLRGGGSVEMEGKPNFRVRLSRKEAFTDKVKLKSFYLMNMRYDRAQYQIAWTYQMLRDLDLFYPHTQYMRVTVNDEPLGMFMMIEPPEAAIRRTFPDTVSVYRRKRSNVYAHEWSDSVPDLDRSLSTLRSLNHEKQVVSPLQTYGRVINIEKYLRWMALNSILQNFDYLDEPFFFEVRRHKEKSEPLQIMAWDVDDIAYAREKTGHLEDPHFYSALDQLDFAIRRNPELFARYKVVLAEMLTEMPIARIERYMRDALTFRLKLDDGRPEAVQAVFQEQARAIQREHLDILTKRQAFLRDLLDTSR
jgi:hypothetical protein